jgi:hypothetical protein
MSRIKINLYSLILMSRLDPSSTRIVTPTSTVHRKSGLMGYCPCNTNPSHCIREIVDKLTDGKIEAMANLNIIDRLALPRLNSGPHNKIQYQPQSKTTNTMYTNLKCMYISGILV